MRRNAKSVATSTGRADTSLDPVGFKYESAGEFIWQTKETEGFSAMQYRNPKPLREWDKPEEKRVIVKPNSVTFRATDYDKTKAMIEVRW